MFDFFSTFFAFLQLPMHISKIKKNSDRGIWHEREIIWTACARDIQELATVFIGWLLKVGLLTSLYPVLNLAYICQKLFRWYFSAERLFGKIVQMKNVNHNYSSDFHLIFFYKFVLYSKVLTKEHHISGHLKVADPKWHFHVPKFRENIIRHFDSYENNLTYKHGFKLYFIESRYCFV